MTLLQNVVQRGLGMQPNTSGHSKSLRARARYVLHHDDGDGGDIYIMMSVCLCVCL